MRNQKTTTIFMAAVNPLSSWIVASQCPLLAQTANSGALSNPAAASERGATTALTQRWSLLGGDKCEWVIRSAREACG